MLDDDANLVPVDRDVGMIDAKLGRSASELFVKPVANESQHNIKNQSDDKWHTG